MKRKLMLLAAAGLVVWMLALLDFSPRQPVIPGQQEPQAVATEQPSLRAPARRNAAQDAPPAQEQPESEAVAAAKPAPSSAVSGVMRAAQGTVAVIGNAARAVWRGARPQAATTPAADAPAQPEQVRATGEIGDGALSADYAAVEQKFSGEARDGEWASAQEQRVRALLQTQPWADRVSVLNCQQSTCRILIESNSETKEPFRQLLAVPGLGDATGITSDTPYSLRNGQLSLYFTPPAEGVEHASK